MCAEAHTRSALSVTVLSANEITFIKSCWDIRCPKRKRRFDCGTSHTVHLGNQKHSFRFQTPIFHTPLYFSVHCCLPWPRLKPQSHSFLCLSIKFRGGDGSWSTPKGKPLVSQAERYWWNPLTRALWISPPITPCLHTAVVTCHWPAAGCHCYRGRKVLPGPPVRPGELHQSGCQRKGPWDSPIDMADNRIYCEMHATANKRTTVTGINFARGPKQHRKKSLKHHIIGYM